MQAIKLQTYIFIKLFSKQIKLLKFPTIKKDKLKIKVNLKYHLTVFFYKFLLFLLNYTLKLTKLL